MYIYKVTKMPKRQPLTGAWPPWIRYWMYVKVRAGVCLFAWIFAKFLWAPDFVEFVFGSFSCFYIEIAYSNFTFCGP